MNQILSSLRLTAVLFLACCVGYPLLVWAIGQAAFPVQAEGSLLRAPSGGVQGSYLLAQRFTSPKYFHPRPSAVDWNTAGSGGSNLAPTNPALWSRVADSVTSCTVLDGLSTSTIASDRIYASGSGLDPEITVENARQQVTRVAQSRGLTPAEVTAVLEQKTRPPLLGCLGPAGVNVLKLNLALDQLKPAGNTP